MPPMRGAPLRDTIEEAAHDALRKVAEDILAEADRNIPVGDPTEDPDPGFALVEHGKVEYSHGGRVATIRYDGPYAAYLHEAQTIEHPRGGKAKFLEDALKRNIPELGRVVAGEIRARIQRRH